MDRDKWTKQFYEALGERFGVPSSSTSVFARYNVVIMGTQTGDPRQITIAAIEPTAPVSGASAVDMMTFDAVLDEDPSAAAKRVTIWILGTP